MRKVRNAVVIIVLCIIGGKEVPVRRHSLQMLNSSTDLRDKNAGRGTPGTSSNGNPSPDDKSGDRSNLFSNVEFSDAAPRGGMYDNLDLGGMPRPVRPPVQLPPLPPSEPLSPFRPIKPR